MFATITIASDAGDHDAGRDADVAGDVGCGGGGVCSARVCRGDGHHLGDWCRPARSGILDENDNDESVHVDTTADIAGLRTHRIGQPQDDGHVRAHGQQHGPERGHFHDHPKHSVRIPSQGQVRQLWLSRTAP